MSDDEEPVPSVSAVVGNEAVLAVVAADNGEDVEKRMREDAKQRFPPAVVTRVKRARTGLTAVTQALECPVSQAGPMWRPVLGADGHSYEEVAWKKWVAECEKNETPMRSPLTNQPCQPWFTPNTALRKVIEGLVAGGLIPKEELAGYDLRAKEAAEYEELMREAHDPEGQHYSVCRDLMRLFETGNAVTIADEAVAADWARRGALLGSGACCERHARDLLEFGTDSDRVRGVFYLYKAAAIGVDAALHGLAMLLMGKEDYPHYGGAATRAALGRDLWHAGYLLDQLMKLKDCSTDYDNSHRNVLRHATPADKAVFYASVQKDLDALRPQLLVKDCTQL